MKTIKKGFQLFIDDGQLCLHVVETSAKRLKLKVVQGGLQFGYTEGHGEAPE